jgi:hypothetical protein
MAQHNSSIFPYSLTGECHRPLHGSTATYLFVSRGFLASVEAWSAVHMLAQLVCVPATPLIA